MRVKDLLFKLIAGLFQKIIFTTVKMAAKKALRHIDGVRLMYKSIIL